MELDDDYSDSDGIYKWAGFDDDGEAIVIEIGTFSPDAASNLAQAFEETRFSISISSSESVWQAVGVDHPTSLGDGTLDFIPKAVRDIVWEPLGLTVGFQFLLLGCACLLYTSPSPRDKRQSRMPSSA